MQYTIALHFTRKKYYETFLIEFSQLEGYLSIYGEKGIKRNRPSRPI